MVPASILRKAWRLANTVQNNTKTPAQYGYRFKLNLDPETLKIGCKATLVWLWQKMEMVKEMSKAIWNWKPVL